MITVICEGYQDRDFLTAALYSLGCREDRSLVKGAGRYGLQSASGAPLSVVPARAQRSVDLAKVVRVEFQNLKDQLQGLRHLVVCLDDDGLDPTARQATDLPCGLGPEVAGWSNDSVNWRGPEDILLTAIWWHHLAEPQPGVPPKQTLERVICSALATAAPDCAEAVDAWLASRPCGLPIPGGEAALAKAPALSYLAGWFADGGTEGFAKRLWAHEGVRCELIRILLANGIWPVLQQIAV